jgi:hypothetical protein
MLYHGKHLECLFIKVIGSISGHAALLKRLIAIGSNCLVKRTNTENELGNFSDHLKEKQKSRMPLDFSRGERSCHH